MRTRTGLTVRLAAATVLLWGAGCGELTRDNPFDPEVNEGVSLREQLVGAWSLDEDGANEIYTFSADGRVELRRFANPGGGAVDRNAPFPETRVRVFEGTYTLTGKLLELFFTRAQSNDPDDDVRAPTQPRVFEISIRRTTLTLIDGDSRTLYSRLGT